MVRISSADGENLGKSRGGARGTMLVWILKVGGTETGCGDYPSHALRFAEPAQKRPRGLRGAGR